MTVTSDRFEQGTLYAHDCTHGGLDVIDVLATTSAPLPTKEDWQVTSKIGHCPGCHTVARDGRRISYTTLDGYLGTLGYDAPNALYTPRIAPDAVRAPSAAFNPLESTTRPAMLTAFAIPSQSVSGLALLDPDTGLSVPSDIAQMLGAIPTSAGQGRTMPAWSSRGEFVAFSAFPNVGSEGTQPTQAVPQGSLVEAPVTYGGSAFDFGTPKVLVAAAPGESNLRPSFDDDDANVAFMRTSTVGTTQVGVTLLYRRTDGQVIPLDVARADRQAVWDTRLPDWGPPGSKYAWIAVASTRPYGHLTTELSQIWIFAVDRVRLAVGTVDPSAAAFWVPGQSLDTSYTHPQWPRTAMSH